MKRYLYLFFVSSIGILFCMPISIQAKDDDQTLNQDETLLDSDDIKDYLIETKKDDSLSTNDNNHRFSSLEVNGKKKKESINFNSETMKINLKYIENK